MRDFETDLHQTVDRMEDRLRAHPLYPAYERLAERFQAELPNERDVLLSRAAVLMLLQEASTDDA